jgi:hypothetical protein
MKIYVLHTHEGLAVISAKDSEEALKLLGHAEQKQPFLSRKAGIDDLKEIDPEKSGLIAYVIQHTMPV